jgi:hypothetical protein
MREATTERQRPDDNTVYTGPPESAAQAHFQVVAIGLGALTAALTQTLLVPVLPKLAVELHTTARTAQWLLTSTLLVAAVSVPIIGRLADGIGLGSSSVPEGNQGDTRLMDRAQLAKGTSQINVYRS